MSINDFVFTQIEYDDRARISSIKEAAAVATPVVNGNGRADEHGADDVDIDAI